MNRPIRTLCLAHLLGNALLLWLGYYWLGLGEESAGVLLWSLLVAAAMALGACWLHGAAFACWAGPSDRPFRLALRNLAPIAAAAVAVAALYLLLARWAGYSSQPAFRIASWLTLALRKPVKPATVLAVFNAALWVVRWAVLPALLLPRFAGVAARGWRGFCGAGASACQPLPDGAPSGPGSLRAGRAATALRAATVRERLGWLFRDKLLGRLLAAPVLLLCAFRLPFLLMGWVPRVGGFWLEMLSFVVRFAVAYLLFVGAWLLLVFLTSSGKPAVTQPKTAVSP
jgi:hypothetical protein